MLAAPNEPPAERLTVFQFVAMLLYEETRITNVSIVEFRSTARKSIERCT